MAETTTSATMEETKRHLSRFLVSGGLSVATDLAFLLALERYAGWGYLWAKGASYLAGVAVGFALNKWWTFGSRRLALDEPVSYLGVYAVTLAVNMGLYHWGLQQAWAAAFSDNALVAADLTKAGAFLLATGVTTVLNFLGLRFITFRQGIEERRLEGKA